MSAIKAIERFPYEGKAYNIIVVSFDKNATRKTLFEGMVHPDYPIFKQGGTSCKVSELKPNDEIWNYDNTQWRVEALTEYNVNEDFYQITFEDGRILKCSTAHKFIVTSPKKCSASVLEIGDVVADINVGMFMQKFRSFAKKAKGKTNGKV